MKRNVTKRKVTTTTTKNAKNAKKKMNTSQPC